MVLQSLGPIKLSEIQTEFGGQLLVTLNLIFLYKSILKY